MLLVESSSYRVLMYACTIIRKVLAPETSRRAEATFESANKSRLDISFAHDNASQACIHDSKHVRSGEVAL
jgi:hypothetical protein